MPNTGRAQVASVSDPQLRKLPDQDGVCAAGSFPLEFKIGSQGVFIALRSGVEVGGIELKPGGWFAYERSSDGYRWTRQGRISAFFAARDLWGDAVASIIGRMPENRPSEIVPQQRRTQFEGGPHAYGF